MSDRDVKRLEAENRILKKRAEITQTNMFRLAEHLIRNAPLHRWCPSDTMEVCALDELSDCANDEARHEACMDCVVANVWKLPNKGPHPDYGIPRRNKNGT